MKKALLCICIGLSALTLTACNTETKNQQAAYRPVRTNISRQKSGSGSGRKYSIFKEGKNLFISDGRNQNFSKNGSDYIMINNGSGGYTVIPKSGSGYQQENFHSITQNESKFGF